MNHLLVVLNIFTIFAFGSVIAIPQWSFQIPKFLKAQEMFSEFSAQFSEVALQEHSENFVCSPMSAALPLAMASYGAVGKTYEELSNALRIPDAPTNWNGYSLYAIHRVIYNLNAYDDNKLYIANKIFASNSSNLSPQYTALTRKYFESDCESIAFDKPEDAAIKINDWCSQNTDKTIKNIVAPSDFTSDMGLVLVSAIYFQGNWLKPFDVDETQEEIFHVDGETTKLVPMMHQRSAFYYGIIPYLDAEFVNIPYEASSVAKEIYMHILMPLKSQTLENIEQHMHKLQLIDFYRYSEEANVNLYLPKFKIESTLNLKSTLNKMGINEMFKDSANFTNISQTKLKVTKVIQKAFIDVNESGSEAGAATAMHMSSRMFYPPYELVFKVNRPFVAIIATRNNILFTAKVVDPNVLNKL